MVEGTMHLKTSLPKYVKHCPISGKQGPKKTTQFFLAPNLYEQFEQFCANSLVLPLVANEQSDFGVIRGMSFGKSPNPENLVLSGFWPDELNDQRDLAVVIVK